MMLAQERDLVNTQSLTWRFADLLSLVTEGAEKGTPIHEIEETIWGWLLFLGQQLLTCFVQLQGTGDMGPTLTLPDGTTLRRLEELHARIYRSIFGDLTLNRTVYGTREGQKIEFAPLDNRLELPESSYSYVLQDWAQAFGMEQSFGLVKELLEKILALEVPVDSLERMNRSMAQHVEAFRQEQPAPKPSDEGEIFVAGGDGKGIPMRRTAREKKPCKHRKKGQKANKKKMAIVGTVYSVNRHVRTPQQVVTALFEDAPRRGKPRPEPQNKRLWACLTFSVDGEEREGMEEVFSWMGEELAQRNPQAGCPTVYLMDGQESLWDACQEHLPRANGVEILDLMHVVPRLWEAAHVFHAEGSDEAEAFARERLLRILRGENWHVRAGLHQMATKRGVSQSKAKAIDRICNYLKANEQRMHYDQYLAAGYPIASGVLEGACRHYVKDRMERSGMRWTPAGAQAMLDLRSRWVNGDWDDYQSFRIEREVERLYPNRHVLHRLPWKMVA